MRQVTVGATPGEHAAAGPPQGPAAPGDAGPPEKEAAPSDTGPSSVAAPELDCRAFYARMAGGVTVVTAQGPAGPAGSTVSAVTSLSADPPLLLICLGNASRTLAVVEASGRFAVNLLAESQRARAELFADPAVGAAERFAATGHRRELAVPVLADTLGWAVCLVEDVRRYGDHSLVVGRIAAAHTAVGRPLLWHDRAFASLGGAPVAAPALDGAPVVATRPVRESS
ncbi:flavin reductase family protein [Streptomyces cremeus]|uniref:Flavin reductase family protein n=1 Tax=Streptomyces cremeus TaxID=66881 RepID=A0ABV5P6L8_STRCM